MKKAILLAAFVVACAPKDEAAVDSAAAAGPAPLTAADVAGTWTGMTMLEGTDSVTNRWTITGDGMQGKLVNEGSTDTTTATTTYDADSLISTSTPYVDKNLPGSPTVTFRSVGRLTGPGTMAGTATLMLASKPDSVIARVRWEATKSP
ncbi:MAG: hypothetical protein AB1762_11300 [Gemmatimonadota bacterium]